MIPFATLRSQMGQNLAFAINEAGQVVGAWRSPRHAFLGEEGILHDLHPPEGKESLVFALNDEGQVVGAVETPEGHLRACLWERGIPTDLGTLGGSMSIAYDINNAGQVMGLVEHARRGAGFPVGRGGDGGPAAGPQSSLRHQ